MKYDHAIALGRDALCAWCAANGHPALAAEIEKRKAANPKGAPIGHLLGIAFPLDALHVFAVRFCQAWKDRPACADFLALPEDEQRKALGRSRKVQGALHALKINTGYTDPKGAGFGWRQDDAA